MDKKAKAHKGAVKKPSTPGKFRKLFAPPSGGWGFPVSRGFLKCNRWPVARQVGQTADGARIYKASLAGWGAR
jgi:hypothetical protein